MNTCFFCKDSLNFYEFFLNIFLNNVYMKEVIKERKQMNQKMCIKNMHFT